MKSSVKNFIIRVLKCLICLFSGYSRKKDAPEVKPPETGVPAARPTPGRKAGPAPRTGDKGP